MNLFSNLTVLSLEQATALPFLTQRLAREGMRVIRIEHGRGDPNRYIGKNLGEPDMSTYLLPNNCGKQGITLNLGVPQGREILHELIMKLPADIFATNNRPGSYEKLGIDYETLRAIRPELIWLGITGFGPEHDEAAYDPVIQARSGWMDLTGEADGSPMIFGLPMVDLGAAEHGYGAVMKGLYRRAMTGKGSRIDISMFHSAVAWMASPLMLAALGDVVSRFGNTHRHFAPASVYPTLEGYVYIAVGNDRQWEALIQLPGFETLAEPQYVHNAGRIGNVGHLNERMAACTQTWATRELMRALKGVRVPIAQVNRLPDVFEESLMREAFTRAHDDRLGVDVMLVPTPNVNDPGPRELSFPPRLGEDNVEIYGGMLGYNAAKLDELRAGGVI